MSELRELVVTGIADKILSEFNPNHDDRGRFSGGSGGGGSAKAALKPYQVGSDSSGDPIVGLKTGSPMNRDQLCKAMNKEGRKTRSGKPVKNYSPTVGRGTTIEVKTTVAPIQKSTKSMQTVARSLDLYRQVATKNTNR